MSAGWNLKWLKTGNPFYREVHIHDKNPEKGIWCDEVVVF